jgi:hypothetical protein
MLEILRDWRVSALGLLSWAVPFALSFLFFDQAGQLTVARPLFKSLMVVAGGGVGAALLALSFRYVEPTPSSAAVVGVYWLILNWALDLAVLVPMSGMQITEYFFDIGLRYLLLPIIAVAMGIAAKRNA